MYLLFIWLHGNGCLLDSLLIYHNIRQFAVWFLPDCANTKQPLIYLQHRQLVFFKLNALTSFLGDFKIIDIFLSGVYFYFYPFFFSKASDSIEYNFNIRKISELQWKHLCCKRFLLELYAKFIPKEDTK